MSDRAATHIALLRGINVGGKNKLSMKNLATLFTTAGCAEVRTSIQSGNVVFEAPATLAASVPAVIERGIEGRFGYRVPVLVRTAEELRDVAGDNPFLGAGADPSSLHVAFLADFPEDGKIARLDPDRSPPDAFKVRGREIFLCCPNGMARTKLTNDYFDSRLATTSTVRNWRTVLALVAMAGAP